MTNYLNPDWKDGDPVPANVTRYYSLKDMRHYVYRGHPALNDRVYVDGLYGKK